MIFGSKIPPKIMALFPERSGYKFVMIFGSKISPNLSAFILNKGKKARLFSYDIIPPKSPTFFSLYSVFPPTPAKV